MTENEKLIKEMIKDGLDKILSILYSDNFAGDLSERLGQLEEKYQESFLKETEEERRKYSEAFYNNLQVAVFKKILDGLFQHIENGPLFEDELSGIAGLK